MELDSIIEKIEENSEDYSMPNRVRNTLKKLVKDLQAEDQDLAVRVTSAVYVLDEIVNDINLPMHSKTAIWDMISDLESIRGS